MTATLTVSEITRDAAREIAANIRKNGHWQGDMRLGATGDCIVANDGWERCLGAQSLQREFVESLGIVAGFGTDDGSLDPVFAWNDRTPTDEVLAALDTLAGADV